jgi:hypothetical protein
MPIVIRRMKVQRSTLTADGVVQVSLRNEVGDELTYLSPSNERLGTEYKVELHPVDTQQAEPA